MVTLHIDSLTKSFDSKVVLSDIYLSVNKGGIKGLIGRSGSGKSTLLKIIFGIEASDFKFIKCGNKIMKNLADSKGLIAYLPQDSFLPSGMQIKIVIKLFLNKESRSVVSENEFVKPLLNKKSQNLSSGELRIIEILLIIHSTAPFVLLDEPFNGLSPKMREYIISYIKKNRKEKGYIITDHDYENVIQLADKIVFLNNGYLKEINNLNELVELGYLSAASYEAIAEK